MPTFAMIRCFALSWLFIKEQLKEPIALFWMIVSPVATYYLLGYSRGGYPFSKINYLENTSWFYAYLSSSVAFFGFAFYIIGRRESGFIRSFVYAPDARLLFMASQFLAYSLIALIYCIVFYVLTCSCVGGGDLVGLFRVISRFYVCYMFFCVLGILLSLVPMNYQNSNTTFSIVLFSMLVLGVLGSRDSHYAMDAFNKINPLYIANQIMLGGFEQHYFLVAWVVILFVVVFSISLRFLRINPVWSRY
ncbi:ABC transporter permease [Pseudomonas fluorescens group sp. PF-1]